MSPLAEPQPLTACWPLDVRFKALPTYSPLWGRVFPGTCLTSPYGQTAHAVYYVKHGKLHLGKSRVKSQNPAWEPQKERRASPSAPIANPRGQKEAGGPRMGHNTASPQPSKRLGLFCPRTNFLANASCFTYYIPGRDF